MGGEHEEDAWEYWEESFDDGNGGYDGDGGKGMGGQMNPRRNFGTTSLGYHWRPGE